MEAKLVIVGGKANKGQISLKLPTIIGRSREADLTVAHPMISRQHCELFEVNGLLRIRDLGSLNGTFVGQEKISGEVDLYPQAEFTVGPLTFRAEYEYSGPIAGPPPQTTEVPLGDQPTTDFAGVPDFQDFAPSAPESPDFQSAPTANTVPGEPDASPGPPEVAPSPPSNGEPTAGEEVQTMDVVEEAVAPASTAAERSPPPLPAIEPAPSTAPPVAPAEGQPPATIEVAPEGPIDWAEDQFSAAQEGTPSEAPPAEAVEESLPWMTAAAEEAVPAAPEVAEIAAAQPIEEPAVSAPSLKTPPTLPGPAEAAKRKREKEKAKSWWPFGKKPEKPGTKPAVTRSASTHPPVPPAPTSGTAPAPAHPAASGPDGIPDFLGGGKSADGEPDGAAPQPPAEGDDGDFNQFLQGLQ